MPGLQHACRQLQIECMWLEAHFSKPGALHSGRSHSCGLKIFLYSLAISFGFLSSGVFASMQLKSWPHFGHWSFCAHSRVHFAKMPNKMWVDLLAIF